MTGADFKSYLFSMFMNLYLSDIMDTASNSPELSIGNLYQTKEIRLKDTLIHMLIILQFTSWQGNF